MAFISPAMVTNSWLPKFGAKPLSFWASKICLIFASSLLVSCTPEAPPKVAPPLPVVRPAPPPYIPPAPLPEGVVEVGYQGHLANFLTKLARQDKTGQEKIRILQLGDSHTAAGIMSDRLREMFQNRFGNGGRGMMVAGYAYPGLRQSDIKIIQTGKWLYENSLRSKFDGPFGITGFLAKSQKAGSSMAITTLDSKGFDRILVEYVVRPGNGKFEIEVDSRKLRTVESNGIGPEIKEIALDVPSGSQQLRLTAINKEQVEFLSWTLDRKDFGIVYESHGVSGATIDTINRWDTDAAAKEIIARSPSLIILAYGTNEGFTRSMEGKSYDESFRDTIRWLKQLLPDVDVMVLGPPDAAAITQSKACKKQKDKSTLGCYPNQVSPKSKEPCRWSPPLGLEEVRAIQSRIAYEEGAFFWNWAAFMGGNCGVHKWANMDPPLARQDHVHLTASGYIKVAEAIYQSIMEAYENYRLVEGKK